MAEQPALRLGCGPPSLPASQVHSASSLAFATGSLKGASMPSSPRLLRCSPCGCWAPTAGSAEAAACGGARRRRRLQAGTLRAWLLCGTCKASRQEARTGEAWQHGRRVLQAADAFASAAVACGARGGARQAGDSILGWRAGRRGERSVEEAGRLISCAVASDAAVAAAGAAAGLCVQTQLHAALLNHSFQLPTRTCYQPALWPRPCPRGRPRRRSAACRAPCAPPCALAGMPPVPGRLPRPQRRSTDRVTAS